MLFLATLGPVKSAVTVPITTKRIILRCLTQKHHEIVVGKIVKAQLAVKIVRTGILRVAIAVIVATDLDLAVKTVWRDTKVETQPIGEPQLTQIRIIRLLR